MNRKVTILVAALAICLGVGVSGHAEIVTDGLIFNLEAGNNPLAAQTDPAAWADVSGGNVADGAGDMPARLTAYPNDPLRLVDANTNAYYSTATETPSGFGLSDAQSASSEPALDTASFTVELWLRLQGEAFSGEHQIFGIRSIDHSQRFSVGLTTGDTANNFRISEFSAPGYFNANGIETDVNLPADGNFHHLIVSYDNKGGVGEDPAMILYFDDVATDLSDAVRDQAAPGQVDWIALEYPWTSLFTAYNLEAARRFNGDVSAFRMYNRPLSAVEVNQNFSAGLPATVDPVTSVPDVVGLDSAGASELITGADLVVGETTYGASETVPSGSIISSDPVAGTPRFAGQSVDLVESVGSGIAVPDVLGETLVDATSAIEGASLAVGTVATEHSSDYPKDTVAIVDPGVGTRHLPDTLVNIVVSGGRLGFDSLAIGDATVVSFESEADKAYELWSGPDADNLSFSGLSITGDGGILTLFDPTVAGGVDTNKAYGVFGN